MNGAKWGKEKERRKEIHTEGKQGKEKKDRNKEKKMITVRPVRAGELQFHILKRSVTRWLNKLFRSG